MPRKSDLDLKTRINKLDKYRAGLICEKYGLPTKGRKDDLIARIISEIPEKDIVPYFHVDELKAILEGQGLPKSGRKAELVKGVLSLIRIPKERVKPKEEKKKRTSAKKGVKSLADEVVSYLKDIVIGSIRLRDEADLERYLFGKLEEFFRVKNAKIISQAIGKKDRSIPDITLKRGKETVLVELKYIRKQRDYEDGLTQATKYAGDESSGIKVILFCYDPERRIKQEIRHIPEVIPVIK